MSEVQRSHSWVPPTRARPPCRCSQAGNASLRLQDGRLARPAAGGRRTRANRARSGHRYGIPLTCKQFGPKGVNVTDIQIETQYSTGASRQAIEQALVAAG
jgi:hypothetical protein